MDTIIELRVNEFHHELEWVIKNQTLKTPRKSHVMFMVQNNICNDNATSIEDPITINNYCEMIPNDHVEKAFLQWTVVGSIILMSIIVFILAPFIIQYYRQKKKSENEVELQQNFNNLIIENNPEYNAAEANLYEEDISSLPLIDFEQIQKGKLIGNTSCSSFFYVKSLGAKSIYIFH